jgi:hypothetical protein
MPSDAEYVHARSSTDDDFSDDHNLTTRPDPRHAHPSRSKRKPAPRRPTDKGKAPALARWEGAPRYVLDSGTNGPDRSIRDVARIEEARKRAR